MNILRDGKGIDYTLKAYVERFKRMMAKYGHCTQAVLPSDTTLPFQYTVGLSNTLGYELVLVGLIMQEVGTVFNALAAALKQNELADGEYEGFMAEPYKLKLVTVPEPEAREFYLKHMAMAQNFAPMDTPRLRQVIWPEADHNYDMTLQRLDLVVPEHQCHVH